MRGERKERRGEKEVKKETTRREATHRHTAGPLVIPRRMCYGSLSPYLGVEVCVVVQLLGLDGELVVGAEHLFDLLGDGARQGRCVGG